MRVCIRLFRIFGLIHFALLVYSCGPGIEQRDSEYLDRAITNLNASRCDRALSYLNQMVDRSSSLYVEVLASAYACKAGFNETSFYINEVPKLDASSPELFIPSTISFTDSVITSTMNASYRFTEMAIDTIMQSTTISSVQQRVERFGFRRGNDLSLQLIPLLLAQMGRFYYYYGNADVNGVKGAGTQGSECLYSYTEPAAIAVINSEPTGSCADPPNGHPDLDAASDQQKVAVLCRGVTMLANLIDILSNVTLSEADEMGDIGDLSALFSSLCSSGVPEVDAMCELTSQQQCEQDYAVGAAFDELELFYAALIETNFL